MQTFLHLIFRHSLTVQKIMSSFKMTLALKIVFLVLYNSSVYGQKSVHLTVMRIDNICNSIDNNKNLSEGISEGEIIKNGRIIGGFSTYDLSDKRHGNYSNSLLRVRHENNTKTYYSITFYYHDKRVIKIITGPTTYYFDNKKAIKIIGKTRYSNPSDLLKEGVYFQSDYYQNRSH